MFPIDDLPDSELIELFHSGRPEAFTVLYLRHLPDVLRRCHRLLASTADAHDMAAEVFVVAWTSSHRYSQEKGRFIDWLYGIATNECRRLLRRGKTHDSATRRLGVAVPTPDQEDLERIEELVDAAAWRANIAAALDVLSPKLRAVVETRVLLELPFAQIAHQQGISAAAARKRYSRGIEQLQDALACRYWEDHSAAVHTAPPAPDICSEVKVTIRGSS